MKLFGVDGDADGTLQACDGCWAARGEQHRWRHARRRQRRCGGPQMQWRPKPGIAHVQRLKLRCDLHTEIPKCSVGRHSARAAGWMGCLLSGPQLNLAARGILHLAATVSQCATHVLPCTLHRHALRCQQCESLARRRRRHRRCRLQFDVLSYEA